MAQQENVSHGDIYHRLGVMEGKLESVILQLSHKRDDMSSVFGRLRAAEFRLAVGMGITFCLTFIVPFLISAINPKIQFRQESVVEEVK